VPRHIVCLTFDFDTQSGFIARGMTTPTPLSRGEFGLIGAQRLLALLKSRGITATWCIPGFTIESHPKACEAVVADGHGFRYDSSLMGADYEPYFARGGDRAELGKPYHFGETTSLIEMPISWSLDDYPHFEFVRTPQTVLASMQPARAVMQNWLDEFRYMQRAVDWGVLTYTMHPYVIGRGHRMLALEDLVDTLAAEGAVFATMEAAAEEARGRLQQP
jgi:peptidoglycan/xylan/chitin deacetylase (PgdA/CDA1 family)